MRVDANEGARNMGREKTRAKHRETIAYIEGEDGELNGPNRRPFFRVRLTKAQAAELLKYLVGCASSNGREWYTLTTTHERPSRLRLTRELRIADYEQQAASIYLRGEPVRISGEDGSCNINFSGAVGGKLLVERVEAAIKRARRFLEIRILSRKRNLIDFLPDVELEALESVEHQKLANMGALLATQSWSGEDFSDWEAHDG